MAAIKFVPAAIPIVCEVVAIHEPHICSAGKRDLNRFATVEEAEVIVQKVQLFLLYSRIGTALAVLRRHVPARDRTAIVISTRTGGARGLANRGARTGFAMAGGDVPTADCAAVMSA